MQESKQRKIYNKTVNTLISDDEIIARHSRNHSHSHKKKSHFSHKRVPAESKKKVKKSRKWRSFNHATLKHTHCASNYVGTQRLTKQVGFLTKGKISDSISRLEKIMPSNLKARADQDLHRILKSANQSQHYVPSNISNKVSSVNYSSNYSNPCDAGNNSPVIYFKSITPPCQRGNFISKINKMAQTTSSLLLKNNRFFPDDDLLHISAQTVTDTLYPAIACANKQIFKEISNLGILKKELLSIKMRYNVDKKTPSCSSNNESSQELSKFSDNNFELNPILTQEKYHLKIYENKFELNPILTQDPRTRKQLMDIFPDVKSDSFSGTEEIETDNDDNSSHSMKDDLNYDLLEQNSNSSSDFDNKSVPLIPRTPSSSGSPVWVPVVSPIKFAPNFVPSPKLYYRQKMF